MKINHDDKLIRDLFEAVDTPPYDVSKDVLKRIRNVPSKKIVLKRAVIIASIVCVCVLFLGAVKLIGWQSFNIFGETIEDINEVAETPLPQVSDPFENADEQFENDVELGEARMMITEDLSAGSWQIGSIGTDDFATISEYVNTSASSIKLPSYIPKGYTFTEGSIEFYLDSDSLKAELVSSETKGGIVYEIYKLPAGFDKKINYISLDYVDGKGSKLTYDVRLVHELDSNHSYGHGAPESAVVEKIDVTGFDEGILIHDEKKANLSLNIAALYKKIPPINTVYSLMSAMHPKDLPGWDESIYMETLSAAIYRIKVESLGKEEVIKIAESIR